MASSLSMASLQAALPSVGITCNRKTNLSVSTSSSRTLQGFSGLQRTTMLPLRLDASGDALASLGPSNGSRFFAMQHGRHFARLGRPADQRKALLRSLVTSFLEHGRIKTTMARAKAMRKHVDHMIELAKGGSLHERRQALAYIYKPQIVKKMFEEVPAMFGNRPGGYTRIIRTMPRRGDNAPMAYIELVEGEGDEELEVEEAEVIDV
eukprot:TRINITY_DN27050_c0_g1_i1.p2 TRINITY_DN27050_c0_g1~~TRINITY_DN27050_c0_g1_i1.p2  ORF type:complete len:208 (-),score=44.57 TRINITY_DN27050_c0_g1_i1:319-942(-)